MTIAQLIEKLKLFPSDMNVVVEGYEDGFEDIKKVELIKIKLNIGDEWWCGSYNLSHSKDAIEAVFINGENKGKA